jgi:hypothetical protein
MADKNRKTCFSRYNFLVIFDFPITTLIIFEFAMFLYDAYIYPYMQTYRTVMNIADKDQTK